MTAEEIDTENRVYLVVGLDGLWHARRLSDGETIASDEDKGAVRLVAEKRGYDVGGKYA